MRWLRCKPLEIWMVFIYGLIAITSRNEPFRLLALVLMAFLALLMYWRLKPDGDAKLRLFILIRLPFLLTPPLLSNDYFRFQWDALVVRMGHSPYSILPSEIAEGARELSSIFLELNSPEYYSIYPPVMQYCFLVAQALTAIFSFALGLKTLYLLSELIMYIYIIRNWAWSKSKLNKFTFISLLPLVVVEGIGNLHFEVLMVYLFFCAFILFQSQLAKRQLVSGGIFALAIFTKLTIAPMAVLFLGETSKIWKVGAGFSLVVLLLFVPIVDIHSVHSFESLQLYFSSFEFNASFYYLFRYWGYQTVGYNIVHAYGTIFRSCLLVYAAFLLIYSLYLKGKNNGRLIQFINGFFLLYCLANPTLHPWYLIVPLFISVFTTSYLWIFWSISIYLSYYFYLDSQQINWWLYTEYASVVMAVVGYCFLIKQNKSYALFDQG